MSELSEKRIRAIAKLHKPRGWKIIEEGISPPVLNKGIIVGYSQWYTKTIMCPPLDCVLSLAVFLHECGHAHYKHDYLDDAEPSWLWEYEAEIYAIKSLRAAGLNVPRIYLKEAKKYVAKCLEDYFARLGLSTWPDGYSEEHNECAPDHILKFAYGSKWREHR